MELPKIDALALPDLADATGVFGSAHSPSPTVGSDDTLIVLMVFLYDLYEK
jgi:hypothetical protein